VVQVEGFASKNSFPLGNRDVAGGARGNFDLVPASWDILEVSSKAFAGLNATGGQRKERTVVGLIPGEVGSGKLSLLPRSIGIVGVPCLRSVDGVFGV